MKKNRIRIHKKTLHMLGNPEYVQFLVNPGKKIIAVRASSYLARNAERVNWQLIKNKHCCEFYSKHLIERLRFYCFNWNNHCIYRIRGTLVPCEKLAHFYLADSQAVENEAEEQD